jgi:hypothetical protein
MPEELRIGLVADVHHGPNTWTKRGDAALGLLARALEELERLRVDLVVDLGDRINDTDRETDLRLVKEVAGVFAASRLRRVHLLGNHDLVNLAPEDSAAALGQELASQMLELKEWRLVFWCPETRLDYTEVGLAAGFVLQPAEVEWLSGALADAAPTVVFTHVPLDGAAMLGNYYFETAPGAGLAGYRNAARAREVIRNSPAATLAVAGHVHWNRLTTLDGVHYVSVQSLTESFTTHPEPAGAWAELGLGPLIRVDIRGQDGFGVRLPRRARGHRWLARPGQEAAGEPVAAV